MYLIEGLEQIPARNRAFAGTLSKNGLSSDAQKFLKYVRDHPTAYKRLLLNVVLHPDPWSSNIYITNPENRKELHWSDFIILNRIVPEDLDELRLIANKNFRRQIESELQHRNEMFEATGLVVRDELLRNNNKVSKTLKPYLLEALDIAFNKPAPIPSIQADLGRRFAHQFLSKGLRQKIIMSKAAHAHLTWLGKLLGRYAEEFQKRDADSKRLVDQQRKKKP